MPYTFDIKVRGFHIDAYGHVNNARYLEFLEDARWGYIEQTHFVELLKKHNWGFVIANINITYKYPAFNNDILSISVEVTNQKNSSMTVRQNIYLKGTDKLIATADVTFVILNLDTGKPSRITDELKEAFLIRELA